MTSAQDEGMRRGIGLAIAYVTFAGIAIAANVGTQWCVDQVATRGLGIPEDYAIYLALAAGTGAGLIIKFGLDKRFIFLDQHVDIAHSANQFIRYSSLSVITTTIFWSAELGARAVFGHGPMMFLGGAGGLVAGYFLKYQLDRRFTFRAA